MTADPITIGIDLGGTGTRFVAVDHAGAVLARSARPTPTNIDHAAAIDFLVRNITRIASGAPLAGIGIGASGPVGQDSTIHNPDTLPAFTGFRIVDELRNFYRIPVELDTDVVCAALGEYRFGATRKRSNLLLVTLGTGIGACLLRDGQPFRGADGAPPEAGHIGVSSAPQPCYCGRRNCFEQAASRTALQQIAAAVTGEANDERHAIRHLADLVNRGNAAAQHAFAAYGKALAGGLGTLLEVYRPDAVILAGSVATWLRYFRPAMAEALSALAPWVPQVPITRTRLGDTIGALGATMLPAPSV
jgi:glucokinase